jgi:glutamate-1-semialdehyde 2,1-aminomutase
MDNTAAFERAKAVIPGGVNSPVRAYGSVGGVPRSMVSGRGPYITDVEGREYVDLICGWGPLVLGHAHPAVVDAVQTAAARGLGFGAPGPGETELAELIRDRVPSAERVRLVSTGTEATMTAIRLARGVTGRDLVIKFAGHYHGHSDGLLAAAGSGLATFALPASAGVPTAIAGQTIVVPYHDEAALRAAFAEHPGRIAAVIAEAAAANMGVVAPRPGFNGFLRDLTREQGALLILDEVLTGFRASATGWHGVQPYDADIVTFGKVVGGGLPLAALAGPARILEALAPLGPVYQAGTLSGNPVAVASGIATLRNADADAYARLERASTAVADATSAALTAEGVAHVVQRAGTLFSILFRDRPALDYEQVQAQDAHRYPAFFHAMLDAGVSLPPSVYEAWFVSAAHDDAAVDRILTALPAAAKAAAAA